MLIPDTDPTALDSATAALKAGEPIIIPTDTVYGLACLAHDAGAREAIARLKERPSEQALAILVAGLEQANQLIATDPRIARLAEAFWPGSLTIVAPPVSGGNPLLGGPGGAVGVRCPNHWWVRELASVVGPLVATSANRHGQAPQTDPATLAESFPDQLVIDGGHGGSEASTVVRLTNELQILREGPVTKAQLEAVLDKSARDRS